MRTIVVTGGAGYIGSHACVELSGHGDQVVVVDNFSNSVPESLQAVGEICGTALLAVALDLCDEAALDAVFAAFERASGRSVACEISARRPGDIAAYWAGPGRAQLNWQAEYDLEQMCRDTWNWQRLNPEGFRPARALA